MIRGILTIKKLKAMKPSTVFAKGIGLIEHPYFNQAKKVSEGGTLEDDGRSTKVKWIAIRGEIHDWAIYHSMDANLVQADYFDDPVHLLAPDLFIADAGAKLHNKEKIREFVECTDEAFALYRH